LIITLEADTSDGRGCYDDYVSGVLFILSMSSVAAFCRIYFSFKFTDYAIEEGTGEALRLLSPYVTSKVAALVKYYANA